MKRTRLTLLAAPALLLIVAACGTPSATPTPDGGGGGGGTEATATPDGGGGGGAGGGASGDVNAAFEILTPPNATQTTKTESEGVIFAAFESTDSIDSLQSFYEGAIAEAGLQIITTTESGEGIAWVVAESDSSNFGGSVSLFPSGNGSNTAVTVTIGQGI